MVELRLTGSAEADIIGILSYSQEQFGTIGRRRYEALIATALKDIAADPLRIESKNRPELGSDVRSYHLHHSRDRARTSDGLVGRPRHSDLARHLPEDYRQKREDP